jgi:sugar phosphate isomerase/epimerase
VRLQLVRTLWGVVDDYRDLQTAMAPLAALRGSVFEAVCAPAMAIGDLTGFAGAVADAGLAFVPQLFTWGRRVEDHIATFRSSLEQVAPLAPRIAIAQAGRDAFDDADARRFFAEVLRIEADLGIPVAFETHRSRILFTPWRTVSLLDDFADLKLNCDLSHWVCVTERLGIGLEVVARCASRAIHIDARVGFEQGPQVSDPRAPEYATHLEAHLGWWKEIFDAQAAAGAAVLSVMPEFGPPPYQPVLPFGGGPIGDRDEINEWMATMLAARLTP